jgi:hypothetical protein
VWAKNQGEWRVSFFTIAQIERRCLPEMPPSPEPLVVWTFCCPTWP